MIRETLTTEGWMQTPSEQLPALDPVCQACGGRGLTRDRDGRQDPSLICGTCGGRGRISDR
jgi:DnaJ-class molecular chaperone